MNRYYLYSHTRLDKDEIFYIGIGTKTRKNEYFCRAFNFNKKGRNKIWLRIFKKIKGQIKVKILEESDNLDYIKNREVELIAKYGRLCRSEGPLANIAPGGDCTREEPRSILQYDLYGNFIREWSGVSEASFYCDINANLIYRILINKGKSGGGYLWKYKTDNYLLKIDIYISKANKIIYQYDLNDNFIKEYLSTRQASKETGVCSDLIKNTCRNLRTSAGGFKWYYNKL